LQELEEETAALKQQLIGSGAAASFDTPTSFQSIDENSTITSGSLLPCLPSLHPNSNGTKASIDPSSNEVPVQRGRNVRSNDPTLSRSIDGLELEPSMIDDCFTL
jgi:hypothetical protein